MLMRLLGRVTFAWAALAFVPAWGQGAVAAAAPGEVRAWLLRIHDAASHRNFHGTFIVSGGTGMASARISHYYDGPNQYERIESLDGRQRQVFRHNDIVHTLWPGSHVALIEQRGLLISFPALLHGGDDGIADWYDVRAEGVERIAGHEADVLAVQPRDTLRYGYRLWADRASGLLLRADVIGEHGEVLETSAFSDVVIGVRSQGSAVVQAMKRLDGYRVVRPVLAATRLEDEGWTMRKALPGFRPVSCVRRQIEAPGDADAVAQPPVIQSIWSDGLTYVSVFIEPYRAERQRRPPPMALIGATSTLSQRQGDWWITVVGDTPQATLKSFAAALERRKP